MNSVLEITVNSTPRNVWKVVSLKRTNLTSYWKIQLERNSNVRNDVADNVKFSAIEYKKGEEGAHSWRSSRHWFYSYMTVKAVVTFEVKSVMVARKRYKRNRSDKEFNNKVVPATAELLSTGEGNQLLLRVGRCSWFGRTCWSCKTQEKRRLNKW